MMGRGAQHSLRSKRGMTLLEIAVAVSILGVMGMLCYSGLGITIRAQRQAEVLQERYHAARLFLGRLKSELSMAFVSLHQAEDKHTVTLFDGDKSEVIFNTSSHEPFRRNSGESDQLEVEYRLGRDDDGERAIIRRVKYFIDDRPGQGGVEEVAVSGVKDFELEYFDEMQEDWRSDWDVLIEDAVEKREQLKIVLQVREQLNDMRNDAATGLVGEVAANAGDKVVDRAQAEALDQLLLPSRVKIRLTLEDEDGREYPMETQVEIVVTEPLWY